MPPGIGYWYTIYVDNGPPIRLFAMNEQEAMSMAQTMLTQQGRWEDTPIRAVQEPPQAQAGQGEADLPGFNQIGPSYSYSPPPSYDFGDAVTGQGFGPSYGTFGSPEQFERFNLPYTGTPFEQFNLPYTGTPFERFNQPFRGKIGGLGAGPFDYSDPGPQLPPAPPGGEGQKPGTGAGPSGAGGGQPGSGGGSQPGAAGGAPRFGNKELLPGEYTFPPRFDQGDQATGQGFGPDYGTWGSPGPGGTVGRPALPVQTRNPVEFLSPYGAFMRAVPGAMGEYSPQREFLRKLFYPTLSAFYGEEALGTGLPPPLDKTTGLGALGVAGNNAYTAPRFQDFASRMAAGGFEDLSRSLQRSFTGLMQPRYSQQGTPLAAFANPSNTTQARLGTDLAEALLGTRVSPLLLGRIDQPRSEDLFAEWVAGPATTQRWGAGVDDFGQGPGNFLGWLSGRLGLNQYGVGA